MTTADVVIIGGGVVGASIAHHLAHAGCTDVLIVERGPQQGLGSTGKATGGVRAQFGSAINVRMSRYSIEMYSRFADETGHACGYDPVGYLFLATNDDHIAALQAMRDRSLADGTNDVMLLSTADVATLLPQLRTSDIVGGSFRQADGLIAPLEVMRGFTDAALRRGVQIMYDASVTGFELAGGRISTVQTTRGTIATRVVVNAAGAWAAEVARLASVELPVTPLRRQLVATQPFAHLPDRMPMVIDMATGFHFRRVTHSGSAPSVLMGWPDPAEPESFVTEVDASFADGLMQRAVHRVPCLREATVDVPRCRAGLYEMTPDHHAILGESATVPGLFFANGFSGHGVMHAPATGRITSDLILHGRTELLDVGLLALERFEHGRALAENALL